MTDAKKRPFTVRNPRMTLVTEAVRVDAPVKEADGPTWIDQLVKDHSFKTKAGTLNSHHNPNLSTKVRQAVRLRFSRYGTGPKHATVISWESLLVPADTEVVIYRKYKGAPAKLAIATFFCPGSKPGQIIQTTVYAGPQLKVRELNRGSQS